MRYIFFRFHTDAKIRYICRMVSSLLRHVHGENAAFGIATEQAGLASRQRNHIGALIVRREGVSRHLAAVVRPGTDGGCGGHAIDLRRSGTGVIRSADHLSGHHAHQHQCQ